jgi:hypothetical protein
MGRSAGCVATGLGFTGAELLAVYAKPGSKVSLRIYTSEPANPASVSGSPALKEVHSSCQATLSGVLRPAGLRSTTPSRVDPSAFVGALCDVFGNSTGGSSARQFECTSRAEDGTCNVNVCKQGPGGFTFDCASFAAACVNAGEHWSGTKEGGKCTRVL